MRQWVLGATLAAGGVLALGGSEVRAQCGTSTDCPFHAFLPAAQPGAKELPVSCYNAIVNGGFEEAPVAGDPSLAHPGWWQSTLAAAFPISQATPFEGDWGVWFGGYDSAEDLIGTAYTIPTRPSDSGAAGDLVSAELSYVVSMVTEEDTSAEFDFLDLVLVDETDEAVERAFALDTYSNLGTRDEWVQRVGPVTDAFTARPNWTAAELIFVATSDDSVPTSWFVDNVEITMCIRGDAPTAERAGVRARTAAGIQPFRTEPLRADPDGRTARRGVR